MERALTGTSPRWVTGSGLERAFACPGSTALPQGEDRPSREAKHGTAVHAQVENRKPTAAFTDQEEFDAWYPPEGLREVVVWYDPRTRTGGYEKQTAGHRNYAAYPPSAIVGTVDFLHPEEGWVDDLKTGSHLPPPTSAQLGLPALAMAIQDKRKVVRASITHLPRRAPREKARDEHAWTQLELNLFRGRLDSLRAAHLLELERDVSAMTLRPGPHCKFCRAVGCPVDPRRKP